MNKYLFNSNLLLLGLLLGGCSSSPAIIADNHSSAKFPISTLASSPSAPRLTDKNIHFNNDYDLVYFSPVTKMDRQKIIAFFDEMSSFSVALYGENRQGLPYMGIGDILDDSISVSSKDMYLALEKGITPKKKECKDLKFTSEDTTVGKYLSKYQIDASSFRTQELTSGDGFWPVPAQTPSNTKAVMLHTNCDLPGLQEILLVGYERAELLEGFNKPKEIYLHHDGVIFMGFQSPRL